MMKFKLTQAVLADCAELSRLTKLSKAHWGYAPSQLAQWESNLTISPHFYSEHLIFKLMFGQVIVAYYAIKKMPNEQLRLECLFVLPTYIGQGLGGRLLQHCFVEAKRLNCTHIILDADPHAVGFYQKYGFAEVGQIPSTIPNRYLPVMQYQLPS